MVDIVSVYYVVGILVGLTVLIGAGWRFSRWMKQRGGNDLLFTLEKFKESSNKPIESEWGIRILHPIKPIERCNVLYDDIKLPGGIKSMNPTTKN